MERLEAFPIKIFENSPSERYIYIGQKEETLLHIYNVPLYIEETTLTSLIGEHINPKKFSIQEDYDENERCLIIICHSTKIKERIQNFFHSSNIINPLIIYDMVKRVPKSTGYKKFCRDYKDCEVMRVVKLNEDIDKYMALYNEQVEKERIEREKIALSGVEDGWTVVQYKNSKNTKASAKGRFSFHTTNNSSSTQKRKKTSTGANLYTTKLQKTKDCANLKRKFEEDKARIARMKANRKFKPM